MTEILEQRALPDRREIGEAGAVATIGVFDGVHRGHQAVIATVRSRAEQLGAKSVVITFEPHPLVVTRPEAAPARLSTPDEKKSLLAREGLDYVVVLPFTRELAAYTPRQFIERVLIDHFGLRHLVIGYDHRLGRGRSGDLNELRALGEELGFETEVVSALQHDGEPISSSRIRRALADGDVIAAADVLGRAYSFQGVVVRGDGRGRGLGFPTANLHIPDESKLLPREGVYAVRAEIDGERHDGVIHIGPRPTFPGAEASIELHVFDFDQDLYGRTITVELCARVRGIESFATVEALIDAMTEDCAVARELLAGGGAC